ncbi:deoxynucleoside monophosphate kinase [Klebsiella phage fENko-Kae01]|nr:deoxynucleoside monophosphate kinase [Klebsiella phage fENko-Kae01]
MERIIVAINGTIGSGKDTFSEEFIKAGYHRMSFATALKDAVAVIFGWDREMLEGNTPEARKIRETKDEYWSAKLGRDITPRWILQHFGTDVVRKYFDDNTWVYSLENKMRQIDGNIIITDCRFPNELRMLRENNATIIEVQRNVPTWYNDAYSYNVLLSKGRDVKLPESLKGIHRSEWAWIGINKPDYTVKNDSTVEKLHWNAFVIRHGIEDSK